MNTTLWNSILAYDLDHPMSEYGFSTRLANENYWTKDFTEKAILEYKKFMYLAATSDMMVSPSGVIDVVWHQHLIFTQSYQEFCNILGKQIQHIPSTHNRDEAERFKQAKERTKKYYLETFGEQPAAIWDYESMNDSLELKKARFKIRTFLIAGILLLVLLLVSAFHLLWPLYIQIGNPDFIIGYGILILVTITALELYNRSSLVNIVAAFRKDSFIYHLHPLELVYLKTGKTANIIHATVNQLLEEGRIRTHIDHSLEAVSNDPPRNVEEYHVMVTLRYIGRSFYPALLQQLVPRFIFSNTANCMNAFTKYFNKSKKFGKLFYINFAALALLLLIGVTRLLTGLSRDKPAEQIGIAVIFLTVITYVYLWWLTKRTGISIIPQLYRKQILPERQVDNNWQWQYFLLGTAVLTASFIPVVNYIDRNNSNGGGDGGSGTSCGSSCGSSCGGCGGD